MSTDDLTIIIGLVVLVLLLIAVGAWAARKTKGTEDFALAGRDMGPLLAAATMIATYGSASSYLGNPGLAFEYGWPMAWIWVGCIIGIIAPVLFLGPKMRMVSVRWNALTIPDILGRVYESRALQLIVAFGIVLFYTPMMVAQLQGVGIVFDVFFEGSFQWAVVVLGLILVALSALGGLHTVAWTDAAQSIFMAAVMIFIVPASIYAVGGWQEMDAKLTELSSSLTAMFDPVMFTPITVFFMMIYYTLWQVGQPYMSIRLLAIKDARSFRKLVIYLILFTIIIGGGMWAGYAGRILTPEVTTPDSVLPVFISSYFPVYISALVVVGVMAAVLTTVSSILHSVGTTVAYDIAQKGFNKRLTNKQSLRVSQLSTFVIGVIAIVISLFQQPDFLALLVYAALGGVGSLVVGPFVLALFDRRATKGGSIVGALTGCGVFMILILMDFNSWVSGAVGMGLSLVVSAVASRFIGAPSATKKEVHLLLDFASKKKTLQREMKL